jgi:hypothetical protein
MSHKHEGTTVGLTGESSDDVVNEAGVNIVSVVHATDSLFDMDLASKSAELLDQIFADSGSFIAADRMRLLCNLLEVRHCSRGGKRI